MANIRAGIRLILFVSLCSHLYLSNVVSSLFCRMLSRIGYSVQTELLMARIMRWHFRVMLATAGIEVRYELQNIDQLPLKGGAVLSQPRQLH